MADRYKYCYAVIPAAGQGRRMGSEKPKQYLELAGTPVVVRTLKAFAEHPAIEGVIVVTGLDELAMLEALIEGYKLPNIQTVVPGGETRQDSVRMGLAALRETLRGEGIDPADVAVLVHDAARCLVSAETITAVSRAVREGRNCTAAVPVKDTIAVAASDGSISSVPERSQLWQIQTPQAFGLENLYTWHIQARADDVLMTDDTGLARRAGKTVELIQGDYRNFKLTTPDDMLHAEAILAGANGTGQ